MHTRPTAAPATRSPRPWCSTLRALALAAAIAAPAAAQTSYCATLGGQLYELDIATGNASPVLFTGVNQLFGIANGAAPGELLISGVTAGRFTVDLNAGTVAPLAGSNTPMFALCNNEDDGKVYAVSLGSLYEVDPTTGAASLIGPTGSLSVWGLDYHRGLQRLVGFSSITSELISVDPATGVGTVIGPTMSGLVGLWYDAAGGELYGICDQNGNGCVVRIDVTTAAATPLYNTGLNLVSIGGDPGGSAPTSIGTNYCAATANSTGSPSTIAATGFDVAAMNDVTLECTGLPPGQFGIFITSQVQGFVPTINGTSNGNLCLGGTIGRYVGPGQILSSGAGGAFTLDLDLTAMPQGGGTVSVAVGETWNFQAWHRDSVGLGSNLSDGLSIDFF